VAEDDVTEQQLLDALRQLQVSDLLVQTLSTVSSLAYHRLAEEHRDLEQARLGIEALRALLPVLSGSIPPELQRDFEQVLANLQLAYAAAVPTSSPSGRAGHGADDRRGDERGKDEHDEPQNRQQHDDRPLPDDSREDRAAEDGEPAERPQDGE
jgi:hypothetical protein